MPITLSPEVERKVRDVAHRLGVDPEKYAESAVRRSIEADDRLRRAFEEAAKDPQFLEDVRQTVKDFVSADSETARMIDAD